MRLAIHYLAAALAVLSVVFLIWCSGAAADALDPDRSLDDQLTTTFTPSRRKSDFVGDGWRMYKLHWVALAVFIAMMFLWGITARSW